MSSTAPAFPMPFTGKARASSRPAGGMTLPCTCSGRDPKKGFVEVWFDGENVVPKTMTATLKDENPAFFQIGLFRKTSEVPETIIFDHVVEATTLADVTPPKLPGDAATPPSGVK